LRIPLSWLFLKPCHSCRCLDRRFNVFPQMGQTDDFFGLVIYKRKKKKRSSRKFAGSAEFMAR